MVEEFEEKLEKKYKVKINVKDTRKLYLQYRSNECFRFTIFIQ